jgi:hypothetical protein
VRADGDFTSYVVARWIPVVRVLLVLGQPVDQAEATAVASFARLLPDWARLRREDDVDVELAKVVLDSWVRTRSHHPAPRVAVTVPASQVVTQELEDRLALLGRLVDGLERLDDTTRVTVVLHHLGELDHDQVADVLGEPRQEIGRRLSEAAHALDLVPLDPACHAAATAIDVPPPSVARVVDKANAGRRRQWQVTAAVAGVLALVAGLSYAFTRPPAPEDEGFLELLSVENIIDLPWYYDGTLHLDHGTVEVADVTQLVETSDGVVLADSDGKLLAVYDDGSTRELGSLAARSTLVSQPRAGWVAWLRADREAIVIYDVVRSREIGRLDAAKDAVLIGFDRERLFFHNDGSDWGVTVNGVSTLTAPNALPPPEGAYGSVLLDVKSGTQLRFGRGVLFVVQPLYSVEQDVPGSVGMLSPDGNFGVSRDGDSVGGWSAKTGATDGDWFAVNQWTPVAGAFTTTSRVVWVVDSGDDSFGLYECQASRQYINSMNPDQEPCTQRFDVDGIPLLAGARPGTDVAAG